VPTVKRPNLLPPRRARQQVLHPRWVKSRSPRFDYRGLLLQFTARVRTTLSLRPRGRTVGGKCPAALGSTGCTL